MLNTIIKIPVWLETLIIFLGSLLATIGAYLATNNPTVTGLILIIVQTIAGYTTSKARQKEPPPGWDSALEQEQTKG